MLYMSNVDKSGHDNGPFSEEMDQAIQSVDNNIAILMNGLKHRSLHNCANIIVVSDHGKRIKVICIISSYIINA